MEVLLLKDKRRLGNAGDVVKVKRGYFRNWLLPKGIATRRDQKLEAELRKGEVQQAAADQKASLKAIADKKAIEALGTLVFEKKQREGTDKIYGSLSPINLAEEIVTRTAIPVKLEKVDIPKVTELGMYAGTIELSDDVVANVKIEVIPEGGKSTAQLEAEREAERAAKDAEESDEATEGQD